MRELYHLMEFISIYLHILEKRANIKSWMVCLAQLNAF